MKFDLLTFVRLVYKAYTEDKKNNQG